MREENKKKNKKKRKGENRFMSFLKSRKAGIVFAIIQLIVTVLLLAEVIYLNVLPLGYFILMNFLLLFFNLLTFLSAYTKKCRIFGKLAAMVLTVVCAVGIYFIGYVNNTLDNVSGSDHKVDVVEVYVLKDDPADTMDDAYRYKFGILNTASSTKVTDAIEKMESELGTKLNTKVYVGVDKLATALYEGEVKAVIVNTASVTALEDMEGFEDFESKVKSIRTDSIKSKVDLVTDTDICNEPFAMYLSGIDTEGNISTTSRSDVNIIAVINPVDKQVLLVNTPRDYFVPLSISDGVEDKLTHAGIYGVDVSMDTLKMLYGIDFDAYFRINFTGFRDMIDALGGVRIYSDKAFTAYVNGAKIKKGWQDMDGFTALGFVRERKTYADGDYHRGRNQMALISALIEKASSSALLNDFTGLMDSLKGSFETSLTSSQISALVRMQLNDGASWDVFTYTTNGSGGGRESTYSMPSTSVYVTYQDKESVRQATKLMKKVLDGEKITQEDIDGKKSDTEDDNDTADDEKDTETLKNSR